MPVVITQQQRGQGNHSSETLFAVTAGDNVLVRFLSNNPGFTNTLNEVDMSVSMEGSNVKIAQIKREGGDTPFTGATWGIPANSAPAFSFTASQTGNMEVDLDLNRNMNAGASIEIVIT